jgi:hypothetical protein
MQRFLLSSAAIFMTAYTYCQSSDTIRTKVNYRTASEFSDSDKRASKPSYVYVGLQANQLLRQLFDFGGNNGFSGNPYTLTHSFNNKQTGSGLAFGLGYFISHVEDKDQGNDRETDNSNINFRAGYDKKASIGRRWLAGWGFDLLLIRSKSLTNVNQGGFTSETENITNGWGLGPRGTLLFNINEKIFLGTEVNWYFQSAKTKSEIRFSGSSPQKSEEKNSSFSLQVPTAIFLTLRF